MRWIAMLGLCSVAACSTQGPRPAATRSAAPAPAAAQPDLQRYSTDEVAKLIFADSDNGVRFCVGSAVRTQTALSALKMGRAPPQKVHDALVGSLKDPRLVAWRERQFAEWQRSEEPSKVAVVLLRDCLPDMGVEFGFAELAETCFVRGAYLGVFALLGKEQGATLEEAKARQRKLFGGWGLREPLYLGVVDAIYQAPARSDAEFRIIEKHFGGCLSAMSRS